MKTYKAAELLIEKIKKDYKDDIALVVMMGSNLYQETHKKSDLDLYFVPKTDRGYNLGFVFIIDDIGYDFWPISWERLTKIAHHDERISAIISEGKVLYYGDDKDLKHFNQLKEIATNQSNQEDYLNRSRKQFELIYPYVLKLHETKDLSALRRLSVEIIYVLVEAITLYNMTSIKRGRGKLLSEMLQMNHLPLNFEKNYEIIFKSNDINIIKDTLIELILDTKHLIEPKIIEKPNLKETGFGFYEETINFYNKIERAYEIGDYYTAYYAASEILIEMDQNLGDLSLFDVKFPDMLAAYDPNDLSKIYEASKKHQTVLVDLLKKEGVSILKFKDEHELKSYLDSL